MVHSSLCKSRKQYIQPKYKAKKKKSVQSNIISRRKNGWLKDAYQNFHHSNFVLSVNTDNFLYSISKAKSKIIRETKRIVTQLKTTYMIDLCKK